MSKKCPNQTMPINVPRGINVQTKCKEKCTLTYYYGHSKCTVTNKRDNIGSYLEINCFDSPKNDVNFGLIGDLDIHSVKLFRPSLNRYNNDKADAEIILTHSGNGRNLYICIPIVVNEAVGKSAKWFEQVIPFSPTFKQGTAVVKVSHFTLNDIIPKAPFIVYEGGVFCWGNGQDDIAIIYEKESAINMYSKHYNVLKSLISKNSYNQYPTSDYLQYSVDGSTAGPGKKSGSGKSKQLQCVPIYDQNGDKIPEGANDVNPSTRGTGVLPDSSDKFTKFAAENTKLVIILCAVLIFMVGLGFGLYYLFKKRGDGSSPAAAGAAGAAAT